MHETLSQGALAPVADVAEERTGHRPVRQTVWRWLREEPPLRGLFVDGRWKTTPAAFDDFLSRRSEAQLAKKVAPAEASDADLKSAGLL